jgi:hypothetical protein
LGPPQTLGLTVALTGVYFGRIDLSSVELSDNAKMDGAHAAYASAPVSWLKEHHVGVVGEEGAKLLRSWDITAFRVAGEPKLLIPEPVCDLDRQIRLRFSATANERTDNNEDDGKRAAFCPVSDLPPPAHHRTNFVRSRLPPLFFADAYTCPSLDAALGGPTPPIRGRVLA